MSDYEIRKTLIAMIIIALLAFIFVVSAVVYSIYRDEQTEKHLIEDERSIQFRKARWVESILQTPPL